LSAPEPAAPFVDSYLAFLLAKASHLISSGFHARLRERGISIGTWRILAVLSDGPRTVSELADRVLLNQPTMSKTLDRLAADGLLRRRREQDNRRVVLIELTPRGRELAASLVPLANQHEREAFSHLSDGDRRRLVRILQATIARHRDAAQG